MKSGSRNSLGRTDYDAQSTIWQQAIFSRPSLSTLISPYFPPKRPISDWNDFEFIYGNRSLDGIPMRKMSSLDNNLITTKTLICLFKYIYAQGSLDGMQITKCFFLAINLISTNLEFGIGLRDLTVPEPKSE